MLPRVQDEGADAAGVGIILPRRDLFEHHQQQLHESALTAEIIEARGYLTAPGPESIKALEPRFGKTQLPSKSGALMYPVFRLGTPEPYAWVIRRDKPRQSSNGKDVKYEWPKDVPPIMDVLPLYRDALRNVTIPMWITEGAKKADALAAAFGEAVVPVNLNGVYGWRAKTDALHKATASLSDLDEVPWQGREVVLAFDSDVRYNRNVKDALTRFGRVLAARGASVYMLLLPQEKDSPKLGVDDFLAAGHTTSDLREHLQTLADSSSVGREKFGVHPETGEPLYFPAGWVNAHDSIAVDQNGRVVTVYPGRIAVRSVGRNAINGEEMLEIGFDVGQELRRVTAPRVALATKKGVIEHLASQGASVHDGNAAKIAHFLSDFVHENLPALPKRVYSDRLGNLPGGALLTPTGSVGEEITYTGDVPARREHSESSVFVEAIRAMTNWEGAWPAWAALGFSLAAPYMPRVGVRRNPVVYLAGDSNTGKTSAAAFAIGAWASPEGHPFVLQGKNTTPKGMEQTFEQLGGLPAFIDEAHSIHDPARLEGAVYSFANGQSYTKGGRDGLARGGAAIGGALLIAGEAIAEFQFAGSRNRVLYLEADVFPPLGTTAVKGSQEGRARSELLEAAWKAGAGTLGLQVAEQILANWSDFVDAVQQVRVTPAYRDLEDWGGSCAVMMAVLLQMFDLLEITPPQDVTHLPKYIRAALTTSRTDSPAHKVAWEKISAMIAQADHHVSEESGFVELQLRGELIGWGDGENWYLFSTTPAFEQRLGSAAPQLHGRRWVEAGLVIPDGKGKSTMNKRCPFRNSQQVRSLCIPVEALSNDSG